MTVSRLFVQDVGTVSTTQRDPLGAVREEVDPDTGYLSEYRYVKYTGSVAIDKYDFLCFVENPSDPYDLMTEVEQPTAENVELRAGVATVDVPDSSSTTRYFWVLKKGVYTVAAQGDGSGAAAIGDLLFPIAAQFELELNSSGIGNGTIHTLAAIASDQAATTVKALIDL